jgi:hypothetical protein
MRSRSLVLALTIVLGTAVAASNALAVPKQIIILRHGEKYSPFALCKTGVERSYAFALKYLGRGGEESLFPSGEGPAAFFAINPQAMQTAAPAAASWGLPVIDYTIPPPFKTDEEEEVALNLRTQQAAQDVLNNPAWNDRIVVMVWDDRHIAEQDLNKKIPPVTLRQLLNLDKLTGANLVPEVWQPDNYDYFWIVNFEGSATPVGFRSQKQIFTGRYKTVPSNDWARKVRPTPTGCQ